MHDLVIRNGLVVDGTGDAPRTVDISVSGGLISGAGEIDGAARREIDADGLAVLPGWVDVHTHYDGQATWDPQLSPSGWNGVTTVVMGNCSVGFAPVRPGAENYLITLMEGVEDIPGSVLSEGLDFDWESFPDYLDRLDASPLALDVGAQLPHAALRFYVMGDRGADHTESPTSDEIAEMGRLTVEALAAGAVGFSTSRTNKHRASDGRFTPGLTAGDPELDGIADAMARAGRGQFQANSDFGSPDEFALLRRIGERSGRPVVFSLLQVDEHPDRWRELLAGVDQANAAGVGMRVQVGSRPIGIMFGLDATLHPLQALPGWRDLALLSVEEIALRLSDPAVRTELAAGAGDDGFAEFMRRALASTVILGDPPDYEQDPSVASVEALARRAGRDPFELVGELLAADEGRALLYFPFENYSEGNLDPLREMLLHPYAVAGLGDGGAHVGTICDASYPTHLVTHWTRDRTRGDRLPLEHVVKRQTADAATSIGLSDRGVIAPGRRADLNVVDLHQLRLRHPEVVRDLPAGGRRLIQRAEGYRHTFCAGVETFVNGEWTGATPGRLIRHAG
ncbi:MAG TPA: amidohydrolase family protein [Acidimicrobiales bacterium]|jgi:N-acyl-D-aspartate/D-glutamate deacylase